MALVVASSVRQMNEINRRLILIEAGYLPALGKLSSITNLYHIQENFDFETLVSNRKNRLFVESVRFSYPKLVNRNINEIKSTLITSFHLGEKSDKLSEIKASNQQQALFEALNRVSVSHDRYNQTINRILDSSQNIESELGRLEDLRSRFQSALKQTDTRLNLALQGEMRSIGRLEKRGTWFIVVLCILGVVVVLALALISLVVLSPIRKLTEAVQRISKGDFSHRVDLKSADEVGVLADEFNNMAASLDAQTKELVESERLAAVGQLSAQVTHEIRNPLNSIGLNLEMLREDLTGIKEAGTFKTLDNIESEIRRLNEVSESYLKRAKPARKVNEKGGLVDLIDEILELMQPEIDSSGMEICKEIEDGDLVVIVDPNRLKQAIMNLIRNAVEAMDQQGSTIVVSTAKRDGSAVISVADDGPGVEAGDTEKIFGAFYSTKDSGTGLGLAITRKMVRELGGDISCVEGRDKGATFEIVLPLYSQTQGQRPMDLN
jgi:signal transduction histidine kinase